MAVFKKKMMNDVFSYTVCFKIKVFIYYLCLLSLFTAFVIVFVYRLLFLCIVLFIVIVYCLLYVFIVCFYSSCAPSLHHSMGCDTSPARECLVSIHLQTDIDR